MMLPLPFFSNKTPELVAWFAAFLASLIAVPASSGSPLGSVLPPPRFACLCDGPYSWYCFCRVLFPTCNGGGRNQGVARLKIYPRRVNGVRRFQNSSVSMGETQSSTAITNH